MRCSTSRKKEIGFAQIVARFARHPAALDELVEHRQSRAAAQARVASAGDELLRLHEEFDLANAAASQFDVVADDGDLAMALMRVDLPLDRMHVGDGGEVEIFAPDEWREFLQEIFAREDVARDRPRLDIGGALPVLAHAFIVAQRRFERDRDRRRARIGTQPQIGAKHIAVDRALAHDLHDALRQSDEKIDVLRRIGEARARAIEEDDEIDVGGVVQLEGAALAHAEKNPARSPRSGSR